MASQAKAPSSSEEGVGGGGVSPETLRKRAAAMRKEMPEPERRLWAQLRNSGFEGRKFRRQVVIGNKIVDFFCPALGLVVEVDGDTHDLGGDAQRDTDLLRNHGFRTVRFSNREVMRNLDGVLEKLKLVVDQTPERWPNGREHHPRTPSSKEEGALS